MPLSEWDREKMTYGPDPEPNEHELDAILEALKAALNAHEVTFTVAGGFTDICYYQHGRGMVAVWDGESGLTRRASVSNVIWYTILAHFKCLVKKNSEDFS